MDLPTRPTPYPCSCDACATGSSPTAPPLPTPALCPQRRRPWPLLLVLCAAVGAVGGIFAKQRHATNLRPSLQSLSLQVFASLVHAAHDGADADARARFQRYDLSSYLPIAGDSIDQRFPMRNLLASHTKAWPEELGSEVRSFFARAPGKYSTQWNQIVLESLGPAPEFKPNGYGYCNTLPPHLLRDLSVLMQQAHRHGLPHDLWSSLQHNWQRAQPKPEVLGQLTTAVRDYLRIPNLRLANMDILINPLMAKRTGCVVHLRPEKRLLLLVGPWEHDQGMRQTYVHEILHKPVKDLLRSSPAIRKSLAASAHIFPQITHPGGYEPWSNHIEETLCRALSYRIAKTSKIYTGFAFEPFFAIQLRYFEQSDDSLEKVIANALTAIGQNLFIAEQRSRRPALATNVGLGH